MPERLVSKLAVSIPSPGLSDSAVVVVEPSETDVVLGSNVMPVMVVVLHGLLRLTVVEEAVGKKDVFEPWTYPSLRVIVFARETVYAT